MSDQRRAEGREAAAAASRRTRAESGPGGGSGTGGEDGPAGEHLASLAAGAARALDADRVGVWLFGADGDRLRRAHLFDRRTGEHRGGGLLTADRFPRYFRALRDDGVLAVEETEADRRVSELVEPYARPLGIASWIDVPFPSGAERPAGLLRLEVTGAARRWTEAERERARGFAEAVVAGRDEEAGSGPGGEAASGPGEQAGSRRGEARAERRRSPAGRNGARRRESAERAASVLAEAVASGAPARGLGAAASHGELTLHYQPIMELRSRRTVGREALLRWRDPDGSLVEAADLVPRLREHGLLPRVDRWSLGTAIRQLERWLGPDAPRWVAVNVDPVSVGNPARLTRLEELVSSRAAAGRVVVELDGAADAEALLPALERLSAAGCGVALDATEAGPAAVADAFRGAPADLLKVPAGALDGSPAARRAAEELGAELAACRVESARQLVAAARADARLVQGRLLGPLRPAPAP